MKVDHAQNLASSFRERGIACEAVYGDMDTEERQDILRRYANHELQMLTNVGVLTEGWDVPDTSIIMMARPTKSRGLYVQCAGRGLRIAPDKKDCLLVDFVDICKRHELCGFGTLAGKSLINCGSDKTLLEELEETERGGVREYEKGICLPPQESNFDLFERSRYVWTTRGVNYHLQLMGNVSLWCRCENGGYTPVVVFSSGEIKALSGDVLPLDYATDEIRSQPANTRVQKQGGDGLTLPPLFSFVDICSKNFNASTEVSIITPSEVKTTPVEVVSEIPIEPIIREIIRCSNPP